MSKAGKRRMCPAVGREITSAECGENRNSRYSCPADCPFNPFAPANYSTLLEVESEVDSKTMGRMLDEAKDRGVVERTVQQALSKDSPLHLHAFVAWQVFFKRDDAGVTCAQRWERDGFPGLKNDQRVLLRAKMQTHIAFLEVRRVLDRERTEVVDLFEVEPRLFMVHDRSLAAMAVRFAPLVTWLYRLPHFWRMAGVAVFTPEMGQFEPVEVVTEIVRHLGGPTTIPEMRLWLAENMVRFDDALAATGEARRRKMFENMDAEYGKALYELRAPYAECRNVLDGLPDVEEEDLASDELAEGFSEHRVWLEDDSDPVLGLPEGSKAVLGSVLLGQSLWRLEAMGKARLARFRERFEAALGARVKFAGERRDDLASQLKSRTAAADSPLVVPRLVEEAGPVRFLSSRLEAPQPGQSQAEFEADLAAAQLRAFADMPVPALEDKTPRDAAKDPALRPKLIRLMKARVRAHDEENLRTGRTDDINWLLRELGLNEIDVEPPPPRAPQDLQADEEEVVPRRTSRPVKAAPLSAALTLEQAGARLDEAVERFPSGEAAMTEMVASGCTLIDDLYEITEGLLDDKAFGLVSFFVVRAAFALVSANTPFPEIDYCRLEDGVRTEVMGLRDVAITRGMEVFMRFVTGGRQPALTQLVAAEMLEAVEALPKAARPDPTHLVIMVAVLKAAVDEVDRAIQQ
ncbi:MAG: hypothetical protein HZA90_14415 [Verrucomicrobia bacterium]|nr:hypothetical protein [Verrucomicrobiota bacterium]